MTRGVCILAVVVLVGCSRVPKPLGTGEYDSTAARETLVAALEAWKTGQLNSLARRQPPIRFTDDDQAAGWQLLEYKLTRPDGPIRPFESVPVELKLRNRKGQLAERTAGYQVTMVPRLAVIRSDP